jgi:S-adenosylmethionine-diacylglycerol 3-amino-3-carboxypropyl transferase
MLALIIGKMRKKKMKQLFSFEDIEEQKKFIVEEWDNAIWKGAFAFALHPWITRLFLKDPGLYAHLGENIRPASYVRERINQGLGRHLAKDALLVNLVFKGKVPENALPPYLQPEGSSLIKQRIGRLKTQTQDVLTYLESMPDESFDAFSLSDVASYLSGKEFSRLTQAILRTARPGARFCVRQFMSNHQIPAELTNHFKRDESLEKKLEAEDNCFVYRFTVGEIRK